MDIKDITDPAFLKHMSIPELEELSATIREFLIETLSKTGGHLSSNLGIVELTIALHYMFDSPKDRIFFDVGHQSYIHKILTGRVNEFDSLRKTDGLSGFQKISESNHDVWEAGHSSTALSAAVAMAVSRDLDKQEYEVIPIIGDAAMVGGPTLEALNHLGSTKHKVIVILNDNQMAIGKSVGGVGDFLGDIRLSKTYNNLKVEYRHLFSSGKIRKRIYKNTKRLKDFVKRGVIKHSIFTEFGMEYLGPVDGHDFNELFNVLRLAKESEESVVIHIVTTKGKGYPYAEIDACGKWHGISPFDISTGKSTLTQKEGYVSWSKYVAKHIDKHMHIDRDIVAITPAMIHGSALEGLFKNHPDRCFDVGIAEEHGATFVAGLSLQGKKPFLSIYSTFLQRAYDQINHDVARMNLPCLIAIDRAGLVGADGPTHHGVFDISFLYPIPNLVLFAPKDGLEAAAFINTAFKNFSYPYIFRISRRSILDVESDITTTLELGTWVIETHEDNYEATIICYGDNVDDVISHFKTYKRNIRVINARFIKPMDYMLLDSVIEDSTPLIVYETDIKAGGLANNISYYITQKGVHKRVYSIGIEDHFTKQGSIPDLYTYENIDLISLQKVVEESISGEREN
jgi:1-deoxy-D-xylulose-5-phosphate synthase